MGMWEKMRHRVRKRGWDIPQYLRKAQNLLKNIHGDLYFWTFSAFNWTFQAPRQRSIAFTKIVFTIRLSTILCICSGVHLPRTAEAAQKDAHKCLIYSGANADTVRKEQWVKMVHLVVSLAFFKSVNGALWWHSKEDDFLDGLLMGFTLRFEDKLN